MGVYIHFTNEQKQRASAIDLEEFLLRRGEKLLPSGRDKRLQSDHSVTVQGNTWYDHASEKGGNPISFAQKHYRLTYTQAMLLLLGLNEKAAYPTVSAKVEKPKKEFALPPANSNMRRVYAYLMQQRRIDKDVITYFAKAHLLYEDAAHHNCVFVGEDANGVPQHAHMRSTRSYGETFRINVEGSDPSCSFHHYGSDGSLYVFEAPIDMMSFMTLYPDRWQDHNYVACCGVSIAPVLKMIDLCPQIYMVNLCLDNDEAGLKACARMESELCKRGLITTRCTSAHKDWNEDLVQQVKDKEVKGQCPQMSGL